MRNKILLIDDDADFVEATTLLLEASNYEVISASNGQEGFQKVKTESPDLIMLDMMMTYKTEGADTAKAITADAAIKNIPIIMITGARKEMAFPFELKPDQSSLPVKRIIEKPVEPESLLRTIKMYIDNTGGDHRKFITEIERLAEPWKNKEGNLVMILHAVQNHYGYVPRKVAFELSRVVNVPLARIYEVITFYHYFKLNPPGRHTISVCLGTACYLKGTQKLMEELKNILHIQENETTKDGNFHLQSVRCIGCCGLAPVIVIDGKVYGKVKQEELVGIISKYTNQESLEGGKI